MDGNDMYIFGGYQSPPLEMQVQNKVGAESDFYLNDLWKYNFITGEWIELVVIGPAKPQFMIGGRADFVEGVFLLWGGYSQNIYSQALWRYNTSRSIWMEHKVHWSITDIPDPRSAGGFVYFPAKKYALMFGGEGAIPEDHTTNPLNLYSDIWKFDLRACVGNCSFRGTCDFGYCTCNQGFWGDDCQYEMCPGSSCVVNPYTQRPVCTHCNEQGTCSFGTCRCDPGWTGPSCTDIFCPGNCNNRGVCSPSAEPHPVTGKAYSKCECDPDYRGEACEIADCKVPDCSGHGTCNTYNGTCACDSLLEKVYVGFDCSQEVPLYAVPEYGVVVVS